MELATQGAMKNIFVFIERQPLQNVYIGNISDANQLAISNVTGNLFTTGNASWIMIPVVYG